MANTLTGRILLIQPTMTIQTRSGSTFVKREIVLDCTRFDPYTGERGYENTPVIEFSGDRCALLDQFAPDMVVTVAIDIVGAKSAVGDRYFNSVRGYRIEARQTAARQQPQPTATPMSQPMMQPMPLPAPETATNISTDLPF